MKNQVAEMYERQKEEGKAWLDENKFLESTTIYKSVLLEIALLDLGIIMAEKFSDSVDSAIDALAEVFSQKGTK